MSDYLGVEQGTPSIPAATEHLHYWKSDGNLYTLDSSNIERQVVVGQGSPSGALMRYIYVQFGGM